jgi:magnesium chelatase subunit D
VIFPFSGIVGQEELRTALLVNAVNPAIGGVLVRGERGTAKSTAVRAIAELLPEVDVVDGCPYACDPAAPDPACPAGPHPAEAGVRRRPVRLAELPVGASTDRLAGSLDLERALVEGVRAFEPGILADAHRGILYVDEVNLLADHLVDLLLDAAALGVNYVEREGVSVRHAARFLLVGTMNPEEGELRPQLLDRFGVSVEVRASSDAAERAEVVRRRLAFEADPAGFGARYAADDAALGARIRAARRRLARVRLPDREVERIAAACAALGVDGMRADIVTAKAALALAALDGADEVSDEHVRRAALLALAHRRRRGPFDAPRLDREELDRAFDGEDDEPPPEGGGPNGGPARREQVPPPNGRAAAPGAPATPGTASSAAPPAGERPYAPDAPAPRDRVDPPGSVPPARLLALPGAGAGSWGRHSASLGQHGHPVGDRPADGGGDLAPLATLRAAAPHQRARGRTGAGLELRPGDLRAHLREGREGNLVMFVVDASGSMGARRRMALVKGAVLSLLLDAYQRRDHVALIAFRGEGAEVVLPPTASVEIAAARLERLATGGRTPLAAGLDRAQELLRAERVRHPQLRPMVLLVTDGRATALAAAERAATALAREAAGIVVVDSEQGPVRLGGAARLATAAGARLLSLDALATGAPRRAA